MLPVKFKAVLYQMNTSYFILLTSSFMQFLFKHLMINPLLRIRQMTKASRLHLFLSLFLGGWDTETEHEDRLLTLRQRNYWISGKWGSHCLQVQVRLVERKECFGNSVSSNDLLNSDHDLKICLRFPPFSTSNLAHQPPFQADLPGLRVSSNLYAAPSISLGKRSRAGGCVTFCR